MALKNSPVCVLENFPPLSGWGLAGGGTSFLGGRSRPFAIVAGELLLVILEAVTNEEYPHAKSPWGHRGRWGHRDRI